MKPDAGAAAKRNSRSTDDSNPRVVGSSQRGTCRQQAPAEMPNINKQLQQGRTSAVEQFGDGSTWCGGEFDKDLLQQLHRLFGQKAVKPSSPNPYWHMDGCSVMNKEAVMVHYPDVPGVFQNKMKSTSDYDSALRHPISKERAQQLLRDTSSKTVPRRYQELAVFNFFTVTMFEEQSGEHFTVSLGDYISTHPDDNIMRVTEIFVNAQGDFLFRGHYFYKDRDTAIAAPDRNGEERKLPSGEHLKHPRCLWLCGSELDNDTWENCFELDCIDKVVTVYQIPAGLSSPDEVPELRDVFDQEIDWFYNQSTVRRFISVEDVFEDWFRFSPKYLEVLQSQGLQGIKDLLSICDGDLSKLTRGAGGKKLQKQVHKELYVLELFAGGGGISHICRSNGKVAIKAGWANDINQSACATYSCNEPDAYVYCQGLEELLQLLMKWGKEVDLILGEGWEQQLEEIRQGGPQHRWSRMHMPKGVGCINNRVGQEGTSADTFIAAARRGCEAVEAAQRAGTLPLEDAVPNTPEPNWQALITKLEEVIPAEYVLPAAPAQERITEKDATERKTQQQLQKLVQELHKRAVDIQKQRIQECEERVEKEELGEVLEVRDVRITDCAKRVSAGSSKNQMKLALADFECWLEFEVRRQGSPDWAWEHQALLRNKEALLPMRHFMLRMLADKAIPMPGDVGVLTGGPPCQNVSGLNRHRPQQDVLNDPKNRLVTSYVKITEYLKPSLLVMEQVADIFKKESGIYARYALQQMVQMGYQCRAGICTAGNYGVAQGRRRAVFLGALSGQEQLPAFPKPTHRCKDFNTPFPTHAAHCEVEVPDDERLYPMVLMGDVLSDLPEVSNFDESDQGLYARDPEHVTQAFLRRNAPQDSRSLLARCIYATAAMAPWQKLAAEADKILAEGDALKIVEFGRKVFCKNKGGGDKEQGQNKGKNKAKAAAAAAAVTAAAVGAEEGEAENDMEIDVEIEAPMIEEPADEEEAAEEIEVAKAVQESKNFARQTWHSHVAGKEAEAEQFEIDILDLVMEGEMLVTAHLLGQHRLELLSKANKMPTDAPLRDHRPLLCNADDYGRMCAVPSEKGANFRSMPGVKTHPNDTCCAGSWHAVQKPESAAEQRKVAERVRQFKALSKEEQSKLDPLEEIFGFNKEGDDKIKLKCACQAGGMPPKPPKNLEAADGNHKSFRVDMYGCSWRGTQKEGCQSQAFWLPTKDLVCPRWCVTYKEGINNGRHGCFGRVWYDDNQSTVVTRAEPHNLQLIHTTQDRVLSIRENARCQGFPDFHVLIGLGSKGRNGSHGKGAATVDERYMQIGNAVSPLLSANLGECLLLAAAEESPVGEGMIDVQLPEYKAIFDECQEKGIGFWCESNPVDLSKGNDFYVQKHNPVGFAERRNRGVKRTAPGSSGNAAASGGKKVSKSQAAAAAELGCAGSSKAAGSAGPSSGVSRSGQKQQQNPQQDAGVAAAHNSKAAPAAASSGAANNGHRQKAQPGFNGKRGALSGSGSGKQQQIPKQGLAVAEASAGPRGSSAGKRKQEAGVAAAEGAGEQTADADGPASKRSRNEPSPAPAAPASDPAAAAASSGRSRPRRSAAAAAEVAVKQLSEHQCTPRRAAAGSGSGAAAMAGSGRSRPKRVAAAAAEEAVREQLEQQNASPGENRVKQQEQQRHRSPLKDAAALLNTAGALATAAAAGADKLPQQQSLDL